MKKHYSTPVLISHRLEIGVFGDYGQGGDVVPTPVRVVDSFELHME